MSRRTILISALLAAATATPAAALAADNELRSHPQAYLVDDDTVRVQFATDQKVGRQGTRITFSDRGSTTRVTARGRHGDDFRYVAHVDLRRGVEAGRKYTVTFRLGGGEPIKRLVLVREQQ
jgi:hypothetical protein